LRGDAEGEAARLVAARSLAGTDPPPPSNRPLVTIVTDHGSARAAIWAYRLSCVDDIGHVVFETIAGVRDHRAGRSIDAGVELIAGRQHDAVVASASAEVARWLDLAERRELAIVTGLRDSHARLSATLLQPGLFDRRAERAAAAQASRVEEAVQQSRTRLKLLARARRLHAADRTLILGVTFRP